MARSKQPRTSNSSNQGNFNKRVFLDIPYHKGFHNYERAITNTLIAYGLHPVIARESRRTLYILDDLCELIKSAKYAVVDISGLNFNVAFEVGYLHALGNRNFIILKNKGTKVPADLQGLKYSEYSSSGTLSRELRAWIKQNIPEALSLYSGSVEKILRKIMADSKVSREKAQEILQVMLEEMADDNRDLPLF